MPRTAAAPRPSRALVPVTTGSALAGTAPRDAVLAAIASGSGVETLATRNSDGLDFHDLAVWRLKAALEAAYEVGRAAAGR